MVNALSAIYKRFGAPYWEKLCIPLLIKTKLGPSLVIPTR